MATAKQPSLIQSWKNLPSFAMMPDGRSLAVEYKTERMIVGSMKNVTQIRFPILPSTSSKGNPPSIYEEIDSPFQKE